MAMNKGFCSYSKVSRDLNVPHVWVKSFIENFLSVTHMDDPEIDFFHVH